jgi:4-hydroxy-tetrahydrodipicolinate synthase
MEISGVWLPIVTPFYGQSVDYDSYRNLIDYYISKKVTGIIPLGTTGEVSTIEDAEYEEIIALTTEYVNHRAPILIGCGGNCTSKVVKQIHVVEKYDVQGILSVSPYYNRPDQNGIFQHFLRLSESTDLGIVLYNIPYRTGRNIENETIYKLAELKNIIGIKDSCGDGKQSMDLLLNKPKGFSVLTGEDIFFYANLTLGGDGGILAAAHYRPENYLDIYYKMLANDHQGALAVWKNLTTIIPVLFEEPNPAPIKHLLFLNGLLRSNETRLPIVAASNGLQDKIGRILSQNLL